MVFVSNSFLFLFLPVFLLVYALAPSALRNVTILFFSWLFYAWWRLDFLPLIIAVAVWSWSTGLWLTRAKGTTRHWALAVAISGPLAALLWFKYANMFLGTFQDLGLPIRPIDGMILPIGLSFFVFGAISYSMDVYRGTVACEPNFINYATYQSMFGHLVAGPVVRYEWVAIRLKERVFDRAEFALGVERFMRGFAQKVLLADTLAPMVHTGYTLAAPATGDVCLTVLAYTLQLYFDFSGYSHMAIGLGLMVGLRFPENFDNPYLSTSLVEFWRRWHISLSTWLRDYLYIPLGGNRTTFSRNIVNLMVTMGLGGLWHGASWTFLAWGLWHGLGLVVIRLWRRAKLPPMPLFCGHGLTLGFVMLGWMLFRAETWGTLGRVSLGLAGSYGVGISEAFLAALHPTQFLALGLGWLFVYAPLCQHCWRNAPTFTGRLAAWSALPLWLLSILVLQERSVVPFLYFQF
jgi:alginate O-acetyltransferase complex protein AlgI